MERRRSGRQGLFGALGTVGACLSWRLFGEQRVQLLRPRYPQAGPRLPRSPRFAPACLRHPGLFSQVRLREAPPAFCITTRCLSPRSSPCSRVMALQRTILINNISLLLIKFEVNLSERAWGVRRAVGQGSEPSPGMEAPPRAWSPGHVCGLQRNPSARGWANSSLLSVGFPKSPLVRRRGPGFACLRRGARGCVGPRESACPGPQAVMP